jgi:hypothetical protein
MNDISSFASFAEFYPHYLAEHSNVTSRRLHFVGTSLVIAVVTYAFATLNPGLLLAVPLVGYGFAWVGHFFFERNRPATFKHPLYSLMGDFAMFRDLITGKLSF